jgi:hypothetical protein
MRNRARLTLIVVGALASPLAGPLCAAEPEARSTSPSRDASLASPANPVARLRAWWDKSLTPVRQREAVRMFSAILAGSQMGPGDGWFGPGQSRYGWDWLAARFDGDADGVVTADEFTGPAELFERLDRDHDGELNAADFDWSDASPFVRQQGQAGQWFSRIDQSSNGRITPEEWQQFFDKLAGEKGFVSRDDLRAGLFPPAPKSGASPPGAQGPALDVLLKGLVSGELGSLREGPGINDRAPNFELETQDGKRSLRLSSFRDEKPVVLVFGSFT